MDDKRGAGRSKRPPKPPEDGSWDCSVCTYKNSAEAYKCEMCDVRKGTSTRKPRLNQQLVAQQVAQQYAAPLSPTPGSPLPDDENDPLFPDPTPPAEPVERVQEEEKSDNGFEPPQRHKLAVKKEKAPAIKSEKPPAAIPPPPQTKPTTIPKQHSKQIKKRIRPPRVKTTDQSGAHQMAVTVDNVTVLITDYPQKKRKISSEVTKDSVQSDTSDESSNASYDITEERPASESNT